MRSRPRRAARSIALALALATLGTAAAQAAEVTVRAPRLRLPLGDSPEYRRALHLDLKGEHGAAAEAYGRLGDVDAATAQRARFQRKLSAGLVKLREALSRAPDSYDDHFNFGVNVQNKYWALYLDLGVRSHRLFALAEHHFRRAMALQPTAANPVLCLAGLYAQAGDRGRGAETFMGMQGRIIRAADHYNLAFYHKVMGDLPEAFRVLRLAVRFDARHRDWVRESDDFAEYLDDPRMEGIVAHPREGLLRMLGPGSGGVLRKLRFPTLRGPSGLPGWRRGGFGIGGPTIGPGGAPRSRRYILRGLAPGGAGRGGVLGGVAPSPPRPTAPIVAPSPAPVPAPAPSP